MNEASPQPGGASGAPAPPPGRVLVTGGSGFIGRQIVAALAARGAHVRVVDLRAHPDPAVEIVLGDIAQESVIEAALAGVSTRSCTSPR